METRSHCQVDDASLQFESLAGFPAPLDGCSSVFQVSAGTGLPYRTEDEVWHYPESGEMLDAYGIFKPPEKANVQCTYASPPEEARGVFGSLPESPHSLRSACSQQDVCAKSHIVGSTPSSNCGSAPLNSHDTTTGEYTIPLEHSLIPLPAPKEEPAAEEMSPFSQSSAARLHSQEIWGLMPQSHCLDTITLGKLGTMGSSSLDLFPRVEQLTMESTVGPATTALQPTMLARDSSIQIDSPLSQSLSESIFDGFSMPDFNVDADHQTSLTPTSTTPEHEYELALDLPEHALLQPSQLPEDLATNLPDPDKARPVAETHRTRRRRQWSMTKRVSEADTDFDDLEEYEPHRTKRSRPGSKPRRQAKISSRLEDYLEYQPNGRKKAAITARGRKVNRLQLSEEDNCEELAETGNRRSKHHNPWTVEETEALVHGVESCGGGKWADIKKLGLRAIEKRSAVDLKDKWRNLQAALHRTKSDKKREIPAGLLQRVKVLVPLTATKARGEARQGTARKLLRPKVKRQR